MDIPSHLLPKESVPQAYALTVHMVNVEAGVTAAQALDPNFWPHLAHKFRLGHEVIVRPKNFAFRLHAEVVAIDPAGHWAALRQITLSEGSPLAIGADDDRGYRIEHDPVQKWRIMNGRDLIEKDLPTEAIARARLDEIRGQPKRKAA